MHRLIHKMISIVLVAGFVSASLPMPKAQAGEVVIPLMPKPGTMVNLSPAFVPVHLQGLVIHPDNALQFDFLINKGDGNLSDAQKRQEYNKLIKYFLASLTVPDADQWVNLSPYEHNRIIKDNFGQTEMGRDLLAQDYLLKQITSSLMYPESGMGMEFWNQVYEKAHKELGNVNIPVNTFNKVWIVPSEAVIHENGNTAFIVKSHLKVMLEEDYVSLEKHTATNTPKNQTHALSSKAIKDIILPVLEKEVNEGKNFAQLRQVFSGMILATWYKQALKESLLGKVYADKAKTQGVNQDPKNNEAIYQQYITAFKKGVFNYIKDPDPTDAVSGAKLPRKYFAGGVGAHDGSLINRAMVAPFVLRQDFAMAGPERLEAVAADMQPRNSDAAMNASQDFVNDLNMTLAEIANAEGKVTAAISEDQTRITFSAGLTTRQAQMVSSKITEFLYKQQDLTVKLILKNIQGMDRVVGLFLNPRRGIGDAAMKVDLYGLKSIEDSKLLDRLSSLEFVVEKETIQTVTVGQGKKERVYRSLTVYPAAVSDDEGWGFESLEALRRRSAVEESTRRALAEGKRITTRLVEAFIQGNKELKLREDSSRGDYNILWESESDDARVKVALQEWIKKARLNVIAASRKALASLEKEVLADDAMAVALDIIAAKFDPAMSIRVKKERLVLVGEHGFLALVLKEKLNQFKSNVEYFLRTKGVVVWSTGDMDPMTVGLMYAAPKQLQDLLSGGYFHVRNVKEKDGLIQWVDSILAAIDAKGDQQGDGFSIRHEERVRFTADKYEHDYSVEDVKAVFKALQGADSYKALETVYRAGGSTAGWIRNLVRENGISEWDFDALREWINLQERIIQGVSIDKLQFDAVVKYLMIDQGLAKAVDSVVAQIKNDDHFDGLFIGQFDEIYLRIHLLGRSSFDDYFHDFNWNKKSIDAKTVEALVQETRNMVSQRYVPQVKPVSEGQRAEKTILIVDDKDFERAVVSQYLTALGYKVILADSVAQAREQLNQNNVSGVVSDYDMPNANGNELLESMRADARYGHIPFVLRSNNLPGWLYFSDKYRLTKAMREFPPGQIQDMVGKDRDMLPFLGARLDELLFSDPAMAGNDKAAVVKTLDQLGGIDMNAANMDMVIKRDGKGVPLPLAQQDMAHLGSIEGFVPRIIEIRPAMSLPMFSQAN